MNSAVTKEPEPLSAQQPLTEQIGAAQGQLGGLERDLGSIDAELERLAGQVEKFALLEQTYGALERLEALGATELFWGRGAAGSDSTAHLASLRQRIDEFRAEVKGCEDRRHAVLKEIDQGREILGILEEDLFDLQLEEEERQNEWVIERDVGELPDRPAKMPWASDADDKQFRKGLSAAILWALLLGLVVPLVKLPLPEPAEILEVPDRVVQLIRQQRNRPVTPPPAVMAERQPIEPEPVPEPETPPEAEPVVADQAPRDDAEPGPAPGPEPPTPEQRAASSGLLAFRESFSTLADARPAARLGADARINRSGEAAVGQPVRAMVTTQAPGSSGGINLGSFSRDVTAGGGGGGGMAGVETTRVASSIGPGGGGGRFAGGGSGDGTGAQAGRTDEEIQIVFDRYKASLYRLYNRELRNDPTLRGQMVLHLTIEPDGTVSMCELMSTDMNAPVLVEQVLARVRTFDFGAKDVAAITIFYPIDFLPAA
ncbi:MAG TPA: AgmX/PglI C-terminal domain-containing protein [Gammaproteobacteria bacterium]|jgi:hypothetical protein